MCLGENLIKPGLMLSKKPALIGGYLELPTNHLNNPSANISIARVLSPVRCHTLRATQQRDAERQSASA